MLFFSFLFLGFELLPSLDLIALITDISKNKNFVGFESSDHLMMDTQVDLILLMQLLGMLLLPSKWCILFFFFSVSPSLCKFCSIANV